MLVHAFPDADIPVVQLSINALKSFDYHFELAARLAPLRDSGVLVVGSGNVVHNLGRIDWDKPDAGFDWAQGFDEDAREIMTNAPEELATLRATTTSPWQRPRRTISSLRSYSRAWPPPAAARPTSLSTATPWARCP